MSNYTRTGRGGAGNYVPPAPTDLESTPSTTSTPEALASQELAAAVAAALAAKPAPQSDDYKHFGRGGGGNWYQPALETRAGEEEGTEEVAVGRKGEAGVRKWAGRGGAGNYTGEEEEGEGEGQELRERGEEVRRNVEERVAMVMERPGRAYLPPGEERRK